MAFNQSPDRLISITTGPEWKRVEAALAAVDARLGEEFLNELRDAADDLADRAKRAALQIPAYGSKHSGLRARVAEGVGVKLTSTVGVEITASMNYADERNLPAYLDARAGWRHPVYGNRSNWVRQSTGGSWFEEPIASGQGMIEDRFTEIFEQAARDIAHEGL